MALVGIGPLTEDNILPELDQNGNLPPGVYRATMEEISNRFGSKSEIRRVEMQSLRWLVDLAQKAGVERLIVNGSFVADVLEPNDVDCVLLMGDDFPRDREAFRELRKGLPFIHMQLVRQERFDALVNKIFATDRRGNAKGVVEVML